MRCVMLRTCFQATRREAAHPCHCNKDKQFMDPQYAQRLEAEIDRQLKTLPELVAPRSLTPRIMAAIARRSSLPWYRQSWPAWPVPVRMSALAVSLALFGVFCYAGWECSQLPAFAVFTTKFAGVFSGIGSMWNTLSVLMTALLLAFKHLGHWFIFGSLAAVALAYAMCVGLGSVYLKVALARRS